MLVNVNTLQLLVETEQDFGWPRVTYAKMFPIPLPECIAKFKMALWFWSQVVKFTFLWSKDDKIRQTNFLYSNHWSVKMHQNICQMFCILL